MKVLSAESDECQVCGTIKPPHFPVCRPCWREVPLKLKALFWGTSGIAHARKANGYPPAEITRAESDAEQSRKAVFSHLKQFSSTLP